MGIFNRLGDMLRSYLNSDEGSVGGFSPSSGRRADPDFAEAWEELDDFLRGNERAGARRDSGPGFDRESARAESRERPGKTPPPDLRKDFAELGVAFGASADECKAAYKRLLKLHHPDRHAGHSENMKKATEKSARINTAYDRIQAWRIQ